jgi:hypothetical protein
MDSFATIVGSSLKWKPLPKWLDHAASQPITMRIRAGDRISR